MEGRVKKGWYRLVKPGDHIVVYNEEETDLVEVLVKGVRAYDSIKEMLEQEPIKKLLPDTETVEQGVGVYKRFYTDKQQRKFGVVAIEIERI
ncbi:hypothetical protein A2V71_03280 [Candidatus Berkelbacteria bacterium RBG_13_40_8]|uniref:ASCH domain-containing protein n=1 Tax=Candidatus Berkelbacteria bacterium RBG_13_40_8 TaxID=1797467 RepID=A0A1F5DPC5_9BACT|nr:MAG: hypothetical protein A2V71_03280 [Candidatus Berkelbacteria bacterium RBG_13_40_8]